MFFLKSLFVTVNKYNVKKETVWIYYIDILWMEITGKCLYGVDIGHNLV